MGRNNLNRLTRNEKERAWFLFNNTDDNRDSVIAKSINCNSQIVSLYIARRLKEKMERINKRINEVQKDS